MMLTTNMSDTFIRGDIDYDRLHDVVDGKHREPSCGKTFAILMLMLGEAQLGDHGGTYLYLGETQSHVRSVMRHFEEIVNHEGFEVGNNTRRANDRLYVGTPLVTPGGVHGSEIQMFLFWALGVNTGQHAVGWEFADIFVDVTQPTRDRYQNELVATYRNLKN